ncbi:type II toxin-antitoxin system HicA family toxin [Parabacteroides sp. PF5-6]|uniref:type II toxin-antitoxin system HicA family toxin n=1 Tax=Parabacteroides sp. PF5-6 TaxID=1742403 RepID=UPI0024060A09|nr:type II toxin-antitoxin system HicA family toxin [Parabacteroides sp. PF5-6]MDF9831335.1 putative RNA binding protein YcfA (HicA-like mRNA interferase family) [Parabacteroides sp. PF5-6]
MSSRKLSNVPLSDYRDFLAKAGCKMVRIEGGHEIWTRKDLLRPIVVQTHESPVPEFIIRNALRNMGLTRKDFFDILFDNAQKGSLDKKENLDPIQNDDDKCFCGSGKPYIYCHKLIEKSSKP